MTTQQAFPGRQDWEKGDGYTKIRTDEKNSNNIIKQGWFMYFFLIQYNYYTTLDNSREPKSDEGLVFFFRPLQIALASVTMPMEENPSYTNHTPISNRNIPHFVK